MTHNNSTILGTSEAKIKTLNKIKLKLDTYKRAKTQLDTKTWYYPTWYNGKGYSYGSGTGLYNIHGVLKVKLNDGRLYPITATSLQTKINEIETEWKNVQPEINQQNHNIKCYKISEQIKHDGYDALRTVGSTISTPYPSWKQTLSQRESAQRAIKKARKELEEYGLAKHICDLEIPIESPNDIAYTHNALMDILKKPKQFVTKSAIDVKIASLQKSIENPYPNAGQHTKGQTRQLRRNQSIKNQLKNRGVSTGIPLVNLVKIKYDIIEKERIKEEKRLLELKRLENIKLEKERLKEEKRLEDIRLGKIKEEKELKLLLTAQQEEKAKMITGIIVIASLGYLLSEK